MRVAKIAGGENSMRRKFHAANYHTEKNPTEKSQSGEKS